MRFESKIYTKVSDTIRQAQEELFLYYFNAARKRKSAIDTGRNAAPQGCIYSFPCTDTAGR